LHYKDVQLAKIRQYQELKIDVLMQKVLSNPLIKRLCPDVPPSHKIDKTFLLAAIF